MAIIILHLFTHNTTYYRKFLSNWAKNIKNGRTDRYTYHKYKCWISIIISFGSTNDFKKI